MKIRLLVFTEGTILMHKNAVGHTHKEIIEQVREKEKSVRDYGSYVPIGSSVEKLKRWKSEGAEILYLTSRRKAGEVRQIRVVLKKHKFPPGRLLFRRKDESYKDIAERVIPHVLVEDDCESIGGVDEMTIAHVRPDIKRKIKPIRVKEFGGIDNLPNRISALMNC